MDLTDTTRWDNIPAQFEETARRIAEARNEGFKAVKARQVVTSLEEPGAFAWRVQLQKLS